MDTTAPLRIGAALLERPLSYITRRIGRVPGGWRAGEALRRIYYQHQWSGGGHWRELDDYDGDLHFRVDRKAYMGSCIYWRGYHHHYELLALGRLLKPHHVFADIGANQGEFTAFAAKRLPQGRVLSFEPDPDMERALRHNVELNGFQNVEILPFGLSDVAGKAVLYAAETDLAESHSGAHEGLGSIFASEGRQSVRHTIRIERFDDVFDELDLERLDAIKIDIEGAELFALRGARRSLERFHPAILWEISRGTFQAAGYDYDDIVAFFEELGYRFFHIGRLGRLTQLEVDEFPELGNILCLR